MGWFGLRPAEHRMLRRTLSLLAILLLTLPLSACSIRRLAANAVADSLAGGGSTFSADDDPELVGQALPFALKTVEALLGSDPENPKLLLFACQGFTQYAFAYVQVPAEELEERDYAAAQAQRQRALRLYLRARGYCLRGLDVWRPGTAAAVVRDGAPALAKAGKKDVPLLYWTAAAWGAALGVGADRPDLVVDWPVVRILLERALALDPDYERGTLHEALMVVEALPPAMGGSPTKARAHFERALALSRGERAGLFVGWATSSALRQQDRGEFVAMLEKALAIEVDRYPTERLSNLLQQRRARRLLAQAPDLFLSEDDPALAEPLEEGSSR